MKDVSSCSCSVDEAVCVCVHVVCCVCVCCEVCDCRYNKDVVLLTACWLGVTKWNGQAPSVHWNRSNKPFRLEPQTLELLIVRILDNHNVSVPVTDLYKFVFSLLCRLEVVVEKGLGKRFMQLVAFRLHLSIPTETVQV